MYTLSACKRAVTRVSDVWMYMWRESDNWLTTHFHVHIGHWPHYPITWTHQTVGSLHVYMHAHKVYVNVQWPVCLMCSCKCAESQLTAHFHAHISHWTYRPIIEHIRQSDHCTFTCTHQVHVNVQWPECLTCACKCVVSQTLGSLHIFMHIVHCPIIEHIRQSDNFTFTCTHQTCSDTCVWRVHVNVQRVRQIAQYTFSCTLRPLGSLPNYMNTSDSRITARIHACTPKVHVNVQWPVCLTCECKCAESKTIGSLHISMHTSVNGLTAQLHEHIRQSDHCTFTCTHQVHENLQWPKCLTCACKCAVSRTID